MQVTLTTDKADCIAQMCIAVLQSALVTIQQLAELVGKLVASFPGVMYGPLFYRLLDNHKTKALKLARGNFHARTVLSPACNEDLQWWIQNIHSAYNLISHGSPDVSINTDASSTGWGGILGAVETGGQWTPDEQVQHINYLELLAVYLSLCALCSDKTKVHVRILTDNTTSVAYLNAMGGRTMLCNNITRRIWLWCIDRDIWLSAAHLPGAVNTRADTQSRKTNDNTEWHLDRDIFRNICHRYGTPTIDMFASRLNCQMERYISWRPDPGACAVDALRFRWTGEYFYAFPPFSLIPRCLQKICQDRAEGIIIAPFWPSQAWFAQLLHMLTQCPILLPRKKSLLTLVHKPLMDHPLLPKMRLGAFQVSGLCSKSKEFRETLRTSSCHLGDQLLNVNTLPILKGGSTLQVEDTTIHIHHLWQKCWII